MGSVETSVEPESPLVPWISARTVEAVDWYEKEDGDDLDFATHEPTAYLRPDPPVGTAAVSELLGLLVVDFEPHVASASSLPKPTSEVSQPDVSADPHVPLHGTSPQTYLLDHHDPPW